MPTNGFTQKTLKANQPVAFGDYQFEIYAAGPNGTLAALPMVYAELQVRAARPAPRPRGVASRPGGSTAAVAQPSTN